MKSFLRSIASIITLSCFLVTKNEAFTPSSSTTTTTTTTTTKSYSMKLRTGSDPIVILHAQRPNHTFIDLLSCSAVAMILTFTPIQEQAVAADTTNFNTLPTIQIADTVKELDFSLPSYDDIKSYKASTENVQSLTVAPKAFDPTSISLRTSSSVQSSTSTSTEASTSSDAVSNTETNPILSSILPSLSKKGPK